MKPAQIAVTIENGMGRTLGVIATVVGLGAMFGKMMEAIGTFDRIALTLLSNCNWLQFIAGVTGGIVATVAMALL